MSVVPRLWGQFVDRVGEPVDIAWLSAMRFIFGCLMAISAGRFLLYGWVDQLLVRTTFRFAYYGFGWVPRLPGLWMHALFALLIFAALGVAVGAWHRLSALVLALGLTYFQLLDVANYLNHYYLAGLLAWLLVFLPASRAHSVDAWSLTRRGSAEAPTVARGVLWLVRAQIGLVYFFAGIAKAQPDWLLHAQPLRMWLSARAGLPVIGPVLRWEGAAPFMSWAGFLFDTTIVGFLLVKRWRPWAYAVVVVFHAMTRLLFPIGMFPFIMTLSALVFFEPSWPRAVLGRVGLVLGQAHGPVSGVVKRGVSKLALAAALGYLVLQVALPLRAFLYPGNVLWHEQGMRFSWRVMVRAKGGKTVFRVVRPGDLRPTWVQPREYLNAWQESEMSSQPDLILQLAHRIRDDWNQAGGGPVSVYAESRVALNGRRSVPFIDPHRDLATTFDGWGPREYVAPGPSAPPPHTKPTY
jgi:vitamin K-dependent gamma-carboxylase